MAQRRLFSPDIVSSDAFLDMPISTQALYFHLGMNADDDGFVNPKKIMRLIGASEDDLKVLVTKRFVLHFESGVIVIKHWLIHNSIRKDRYHPTRYLDEKKSLFIKDNNSYTDSWQPNGNQMVPEVKLSKVKLSIMPKGMEEEVTYHPEDGEGNLTRKIKGLKNPLTDRGEFNLEVELKNMTKLSIPYKIVAHYFVSKGFKFLNWDQYYPELARNLKISKTLKGYTGQQINNAMEHCKKEWGDNWTLETVAKWVAQTNLK